MRSDADWILQAQLPDGAIASSVDRQYVSPYLASYAAMGLARATAATGDPQYANAAWRWLTWYQAHQNSSGYVTDYTISGGSEQSTNGMDSTDAYAATFLLAVRDAWSATSDRHRLRTLQPAVTLAVKAIESTQDTDGLTWAKPSWHVKYLMDQSETYAGLKAAVQIANAFPDKALASRAAADAARVASGLSVLWNTTTRAYDWAVHTDGSRQTTDWLVLYSDSVEEIWSVAFGLADSSRAPGIAATFVSAQPAWDQPTASAVVASGAPTVGYWPAAGWAFTRLGDSAKAQSAAASIRSAALASGRAWPFSTGSAGQLIELETGGYP